MSSVKKSVCQNAGSYQKNGVHFERTHNKLWYAIILGAHLTDGTPASRGLKFFAVSVLK